MPLTDPWVIKKQRDQEVASLVRGPSSGEAFSPEGDKAIAEHMNAFLDELKWFREHGIKVHLSPTATGWNLKFSVPDK